MGKGRQSGGNGKENRNVCVQNLHLNYGNENLGLNT